MLLQAASSFIILAGPHLPCILELLSALRSDVPAAFESCFEYSSMDCATFFLSGGRPVTAARRLWRISFVVVYSCRAMLTQTKKMKLGRIRRGPSYITLNISHSNDEDKKYGGKSHAGFSLVDTKALANIVNEKSFDELSRLGGVQGLIEALASDAENGIQGDTEDVCLRRETLGSNTYAKPKPKGFFRFVFDALNDFFLILLIACAVLSLGFGIKEHGIKDGWYDGASIFLAIFLVTIVSAVSNFRQERRFDKLSSECHNIRVNVVRDGRRQDVSIFDVVVGDVVCLKIGDQVPANGLFLDGHSLQIDESSMTGETNPVNIDGIKNPFLASGVKVADGYARMLVTSVGMNTTWGEMMSSITRDTNEQTPLQERLQRLTSSIGKIGMAVAFVVLAVLMIRYFTGNTTDENGQPEFNRRKATVNNVISAIVSIVSDSVTIVVVAVPEGLPLAVTLTLAYSMKRMMKDQALVRRLSACETMGSATAICTDKTGTLTLNQMKVTKFCVGGEEIVCGTSSIATSALELLCQSVGFNTSGSIFKPDSVSNVEIYGSPTEKALLSWGVEELGLDVENLKKNFRLVHVEAFNSEKKRSGVLVKDGTGEVTNIYWKGAAEMILAKCSNFLEREGRMKEIDEARRMMFGHIIKDMAAHSLRCIAFAYKEAKEEDIQVSEDGKIDKLKEDGLTLLGLVGLKDPCRPEVRSAVEACRGAGVAIKMITGDNVFTARAIAIECGILKQDADDLDGLVIEGQEFRNYSAEQRMDMVDRISVMARSSPFDKLLMVQCLKQKGHVVAVTGDGTNDAPALKEADVGLSMGIQGTEVAKESSDIVILNDNFATVVTVLQWGRCVYNNIQKFIQFQLTVNVAALVVNFVSAISSGDVPLTTVQLLWVNLIMDTLGALALATERPTKELMKQPPIGRTAPLISNVMWRNLIAQALFQVAVLLTFQFKGGSIFGVNDRVKNTLLFNTFVLCQLFNEFNARKLEKKNVFKGIHKNKLFLGIVVATLILQVAMVEFLNRFASTERLNWAQWSICVGIAAVSWPIGWIVKCIPVSDTHVFQLLKHCKYAWGRVSS